MNNEPRLTAILLSACPPDDAQQRREKIIQQNKSPLFRAHSVRGAGRAPPYSICVRHTSKTSPTGQWSDPYTSL